MLNKNDLEKLENFDIVELCKNKRLALIPAGQMSVFLYNYLKENGIEAEIFIDNNPKKHGSFIDNKKIISFEDFLEIKDNYLTILSARMSFSPKLKKQLEENNVNFFENTYNFLNIENNNKINPKKSLISKFEDYKKTYNLLADDLSKQTLDAVLIFKILKNSNILSEIVQPEENLYFEDDIYKISATDNIIDCGAFDGDTLENCLKKTKTISNYWAFEPDEENFKKLNEKRKNYKNIHPLKKGVFSKTQTVYFNSTSGVDSRIKKSGNEKIDVVALDDEFYDKKISFVKMDIEGAEIDALKGMKNILKGQSPTLTISLYHKFCDIFDIINYINSINNNYKFYIRHYSLTNVETVLYAIKGRKNDK